MITFSLHQLNGVTVKTRSGDVLGTIKDLVVEAEIIRLSAIVVRPFGLVKSLIAGDLVIPVEKIIQITLEAVIVDDMSVHEQQTEKNAGIKLAPGNDAVLTIEKE